MAAAQAHRDVLAAARREDAAAAEKQLREALASAQQHVRNSSQKGPYFSACTFVCTPHMLCGSLALPLERKRLCTQRPWNSSAINRGMVGS